MQSSLKPRAWLYLEVAGNHDDYWLRVDLNEIKDE